MRSRFTKKNQQSSAPTWLRVLSKPLIALGLFLSTLLFASLPSSKATNNPVWQPAPTQAVDPAMQDMELTAKIPRLLNWFWQHGPAHRAELELRLLRTDLVERFDQAIEIDGRAGDVIEGEPTVV